jgi:hypothetical protein
LLDWRRSSRFPGALISSAWSQIAAPLRSSGIRIVQTKFGGGNTGNEIRALEKAAVGWELSNSTTNDAAILAA